jgi:hypothetical protein
MFDDFDFKFFAWRNERQTFHLGYRSTWAESKRRSRLDACSMEGLAVTSPPHRTSVQLQRNLRRGSRDQESKP